MPKPEPTDWRRSSYCGTNACVEIHHGPDGRVAIRASGRPDDRLTFTAEEWLAFVAGVQAGEFGSAAT